METRFQARFRVQNRNADNGFSNSAGLICFQHSISKAPARTKHAANWCIGLVSVNNSNGIWQLLPHYTSELAPTNSKNAKLMSDFRFESEETILTTPEAELNKAQFQYSDYPYTVKCA
eukprot:6183625-Pleurochrysis_carterae.AAC.1